MAKSIIYAFGMSAVRTRGARFRFLLYFCLFIFLLSVSWPHIDRISLGFPINDEPCAVKRAQQKMDDGRSGILAVNSTSSQHDLIAIPVLGVMIMNGEELLLQLLRSIDHVIITLVIFHNSDSDEKVNERVRSFVESLQLRTVDLGHDNIKQIISLYRTRNLGFSAGINKMILATPQAPFWLFTSHDVQFRSGALREIAVSINRVDLQHNKTCMWGLAGDPVSPYASFIVTRRAVMTVGFFDENFWPAYAEDCDYTVRLVRARCPILFEKNLSRIAKHETSASLKRASANSTYPALVAQSGSGFNNFDYIISKWGVNVCGLRLSHTPFISAGGFELPFNRAQDKLSTWKVDMVRREARRGPRECVICSSDEMDRIA